MGRHRLPEDLLRVPFSLRLPRYLLSFFELKGDARKEVEKLLLEAYKRETGK